MNKQELYQELYIETFKSFIKAEADFAKAREVICSLKCDYVEKKIKCRFFIYDGVKYIPAVIKLSFSRFYKNFSFTIYFIAEPDFIRSNYTLTRKETQKLRGYSENVYTKVNFSSISQSEYNKKLIDDGWLWEFEGLKNGISLLQKAAYTYELEEFADDGFIEQRLCFDKKPLW